MYIYVYVIYGLVMNLVNQIVQPELIEANCKLPECKI